jgi:lipoprotein-anchoring transpeptidase ErfK/SrfK
MVFTVQRIYISAFIVMFVLQSVIGASQKASKTGSSGQTSVDTQQQLAVQVALDRAGFSPGEIDGRIGPKTRLALSEFQKSTGLQPTGVSNEETIAALRIAADPLVSYTIAQQDVAGPFIDELPADMMAAAKLPGLSYTSALELLGEKFHSSPALLKKLNPEAKWAAGEQIRVPDVEPFELPSKNEKPAPSAKTAAIAKPAAGAKPAAAKPAAPAGVEVVISAATQSLVVRDEAGKVLMHAPVTVGSTRDPLPIGDWKVVGVSWNPVFNYNPELFWDADPSHAKAKIPPGPNNPVGVVWVDISKPHFGVHGTPEPSTIGRTESHGCVRLTNWDATKLGRLVSVGTRVTIQ